MPTTPPLFSTFTLFTEILVTASVLYILYSGYKHNIYRKKLVFITLAYEILFNISYMSLRAIEHEKAPAHVHTPFHIAVAAFHGIFSILMFILLIVFLLFAWRRYEKGENFFKEHKKLTWTFIVLWMTAISSGLLFYYLAYFTRT